MDKIEKFEVLPTQNSRRSSSVQKHGTLGGGKPLGMRENKQNLDIIQPSPSRSCLPKIKVV
jgi:hypothetical protein